MSRKNRESKAKLLGQHSLDKYYTIDTTDALDNQETTPKSSKSISNDNDTDISTNRGIQNDNDNVIISPKQAEVKQDISKYNDKLKVNTIDEHCIQDENSGTACLLKSHQAICGVSRTDCIIESDESKQKAVETQIIVQNTTQSEVLKQLKPEHSVTEQILNISNIAQQKTTESQATEPPVTQPRIIQKEVTIPDTTGQETARTEAIEHGEAESKNQDAALSGLTNQIEVISDITSSIEQTNNPELFETKEVANIDQPKIQLPSPPKENKYKKSKTQNLTTRQNIIPVIKISHNSEALKTLMRMRIKREAAKHEVTTLPEYFDKTNSTDIDDERLENTIENTKEIILTEGFANIEDNRGRTILTVKNNNEIYTKTLVMSRLVGILNVGRCKIDDKSIYKLQKAGAVVVNIARTQYNESWELKIGGPLQKRFGKYESWWAYEHGLHIFQDSHLRIPYCKCLVSEKIRSIRNLGQMEPLTYRELIDKVTLSQNLDDLQKVISIEGALTEYHQWYYLRVALISIEIEFKERIRFGNPKDKNKDQDVVNYILDYLMVCLRYYMVVLLAHANITPYISLLHRVGDLFHMSLASDLMTPFEPYMARLTFEVLRDGISRYTEATMQGERKIYQLNSEGRKILFEAFVVFITTYHLEINVNRQTGTILDQIYNQVHRLKNIITPIKNKKK